MFHLWWKPAPFTAGEDVTHHSVPAFEDLKKLAQIIVALVGNVLTIVFAGVGVAVIFYPFGVPVLGETAFAGQVVAGVKLSTGIWLAGATLLLLTMVLVYVSERADV